LPRGSESREARISRARDKKLPKLDFWKGTANARTVLVLEENDLQTTNVPLVCDAYLAVVEGRADIPEETWLFSTAFDPWYEHPLLVDGRTYYDHAQEFRGAVGWQVDPDTMTIIRLP